MVEDGYPGVGGNTGEALEKLCDLNDKPNIIHLRKKISLSELEELTKCEHFDVVLALNFLHHQGNEWKRCLDAVLQLGDHIIVEQATDFGEHVLQAIEGLENKQLLGEFSRHTSHQGRGKMYWIKSFRDTLTRNNLIEDRMSHFQIQSDYDKKFLLKMISNGGLEN